MFPVSPAIGRAVAVRMATVMRRGLLPRRVQRLLTPLVLLLVMLLFLMTARRLGVTDTNTGRDARPRGVETEAEAGRILLARSVKTTGRNGKEITEERRQDKGKLKTQSHDQDKKELEPGRQTEGKIWDNGGRGVVQDSRGENGVPRKDAPIFANISKIGKSKSLFAMVPEEPYLVHNRSVFVQNMSIDNSFDYDLLINGSRLCASSSKVFILIIIPSVADNYKMRKIIRTTWLGVGERELWPHVKVGVTVKHIFLLGLRPKMDLTFLRAESQQHGDLVLAAFEDSYRNLTTKVLVGFQWAGRFCPQAEVVLKVDQDTLINMPLMAALLRHTKHQARRGYSAFVMGLNHVKPVVRRVGRWGVAESEYPLPAFPVYLYGHTYAVSAPSATTRLLAAARRFPLLAPEDAFITGFLAKAAGVARFTSRAFTVCCRRLISRCEVVWNQRVAFTGLNTVSLMDGLWADIMHGHCDPNVHYREKKIRNETKT